jgi:hypothetical protein
MENNMDIVQPTHTNSNDLGEKSNVSSTYGNIKTILDANNEIAEKRKLNHREAMQFNTNALKSGVYSKFHPIPDFVYLYLNFLDELQLNSLDEIKRAMTKLTIDNLKRITLQMHVEQAKGGEQDINLTKLIKTTFYMLQVLLQPTDLQNVIGNQMNTQISLGTINQLNENERQTALTIIKEALAGATDKTQGHPA